ncbi:MAG: hypothetical protein Q4G27_08395 [Flavobacteriaceae bacterium]|nr:hypothetical protein [Flavobacteriaceae bacterium]
MKNQILNRGNYYWSLLIMFLASPLAFAQEDVLPDVDINVTKETTTEEWYTNPMYLIIGALVLLLLVAIIARGGRK